MFGKKELIAILALLIVSSAIQISSRTESTRPEAVATVQTVEVTDAHEKVESRDSAPAPAQLPTPRPLSTPANTVSVASVQPAIPSPTPASQPSMTESPEVSEAERSPALDAENANEPYSAGKIWEIHDSELEKFEAASAEEKVAIIEENHRIRGLPELSPEETQALVDIQKQMEFPSQPAGPTGGIHE